MTTGTKPVQENYFYNKVIKLTGHVFGDKKGCLLVTSIKGYKYITIVYDNN